MRLPLRAVEGRTWDHRVKGTEPGRGFHGKGREAHGTHGSHFPTGRPGRPGSRALLCGPKTLPGPTALLLLTFPPTKRRLQKSPTYWRALGAKARPSRGEERAPFISSNPTPAGSLVEPSPR